MLLVLLFPWDLWSRDVDGHIAPELIDAAVVMLSDIIPGARCHLLFGSRIAMGHIVTVICGHIARGQIVVCCLVALLRRDLLASVVGGHIAPGPNRVCCWWPCCPGT